MKSTLLLLGSLLASALAHDANDGVITTFEAGQSARAAASANQTSTKQKSPAGPSTPAPTSKPERTKEPARRPARPEHLFM